MLKRVLVTGATGFIGRHCLQPLRDRGYEVHAVSSRPIVSAGSDVHWHQLSLLDAPQLTNLTKEIQASHLLHLAWYTVHGECYTSPENVRWVQASLQLLQLFAASGGQRVVVSGSCAEYDWRYGYCSEQVTPLSGQTLYGKCKHALQTIQSPWAQACGLSAAWARIFFLFGPHEHPNRLVAYVAKSLLSGQIARCSHGNQIRDFLFVQDVADALVALLDSNVSGPVISDLAGRCQSGN